MAGWPNTDHYRDSQSKLMLFMSLKCTPVTQSTLCLIFFICIATMYHLTTEDMKLETIGSLWFWHTCDLELRSRSSNLEWFASPRARLLSHKVWKILHKLCLPRRQHWSLRQIRKHINYLPWIVPAGSSSHDGDVMVSIRHKPPSLPIPLYSLLVSISVFLALSTVFHSINSPNNALRFHSVLLVLSLPHWSFQLYTSLWKSPSALI